jgi:hypothetical protein
MQSTLRAVRDACRDQCRLEGEPLAGSAGAAAALVAIEWPKPLWHDDDVLLSEGLPASLRGAAERMRERLGKLAVRAFQRRPRPRTDRVEVIAWRPRERRALVGRDVPVADALDFADRALAGDAPAEPLPPLLLVCTDGRHDRCCAEHGRAMFDAIEREVARQGAALELAESSHLGGHRFAATCLALPGGAMHGRLRPDDAPALVAALARGAPLVPRYRGRFGLSEPDQVAEAFAYARFPRALEVRVAAGDGAARRASVKTAGAGHELVVQLAEREFLSPTSCSDDAEEPRRRWVVSAP